MATDATVVLRKPKRRWFQFSLRTLLALTTFLAICLGWYVNRVQRHRRAILAIEASGGWVRFDYHYDGSGKFKPDAEPDAPRWLRNLMGDEAFGKAKIVGLQGDAVTDEILTHLVALSSIEQLQLDETRLTEEGFEQLSTLPNLRVLSLSGANITDATLATLSDLTDLEVLSVGLGSPERVPVTDDGLVHLKPLTELWRLHLSRTDITDAGLEHLTVFTGLKTLNLEETQVTSQGIKTIQAALPNVRVFATKQKGPVTPLRVEAPPNTTVEGQGTTDEARGTGTSVRAVAVSRKKTVPGGGNESLTAEEAMKLYLTASRSIHSYDLRMTVTYKPMPGMPVDKHYRQVYSGGKRRIENLDGNTGKATRVLVSDGKVDRAWNPPHGRVWRGRAQGMYLGRGTDYLAWFRGSMDLLSIMRQRKTVRVSEDEGMILLEIPNLTIEEFRERLAAGVPDFVVLPRAGFKVWLDPQHGMMPARIEEFRLMFDDGAVIPRYKLVVDEFKQVEPGLWVPVRATGIGFGLHGRARGKPNNEAVAVVDVENSKWNTPPANNAFEPIRGALGFDLRRRGNDLRVRALAD